MAKERTSYDSLDAHIREPGDMAPGWGLRAAPSFPESEIGYWRGVYEAEPYFEHKLGFHDYLPAYELGWLGHAAYGGAFEAAERLLANDWDYRKGVSALTWDEARPAARAAWQRAYNAQVFSTEGSAPRETAIATLNDLLQNARDGETGFREAAENARTHTLATLFERCAASCGRAAAQLEEQIVQRGGEVAESGSVLVAAHRVRVQLRGFFGGASDEKMLEECERGEDVALARLRQALAEDLPADLHAMVLHQYEVAQRNHDMVRTMLGRARAAFADAREAAFG
ncbi:MAG: PA2169 family four-helix-bundle protein [Pseudomonadota bacterium]